MSNEALNAVFQHSNSTGTARLVMLSIADRADKLGRAFCGAADICRRTKASRASVFVAIRSLRETGELDIEDEKGPRDCNRYRIMLVQNLDYSERSTSPESRPHQSRIKTSSSPESRPGVVQNLDPNPPYNPPSNHPERERCISLEIAVSMFAADFPDRPVKLSLTDLVAKKGEEFLTPSYCRQWLQNERRRKKEPKDIRAGIDPKQWAEWASEFPSPPPLEIASEGQIGRFKRWVEENNKRGWL